MKHILSIIILSLVLFSCNNNPTSENTETIVEVNPQIIIEGLNITMADSVVKLYKSDITKAKLKEDYILVDFFRVYNEAIEEINGDLYGLEYFQELNTLAGDNPSEKAKKFEKSLNENGISFQSSEGEIYLTLSTKYISEEFSPILSAEANHFLKLYLNEIDNSCCEDASLSISYEELINRTYAWGNVFYLNNGIWITKTAKSEYKKYLILLFEGVDNSPAFDFENNKFNQEIIDLMNKNIEQFPESGTSKFFKDYLELLKKENYKKTKAINEHIADIDKFLVV